MTIQIHNISLYDISRMMRDVLSVRPTKRSKRIKESISFKGPRTIVLMIASFLFYAFSPSLLPAQNISRTLATNTSDMRNIGYAMMGPSNSIAVINMNSKRIIDSIPVEGNPHGGALTPDGDYIYTSSMDTKWVSVVDTRTGEIITKIDVGSISHHATVRVDGRYVYIAADRLIVIDTATNEIRARVNTTESPFYPVFGSDESLLYVLSMGSTISVIDTETHEQIDTIEMGAKSMMGHLAVAPDGNTLYATNDMADRLSIIDVESGRLRGAVSVGKQPHGIVVSSDGARVFVSNRGEPNISVVDPKKAKLVATRKLDGYPEHLSMTADGNYLLVGLKDRFQKERAGQKGSRDMTAAVTIIDPNSLEIVEEMAVWPQVHDILVPKSK